MMLPPYSMGIGDRFGRQGAAQLSAFVKARASGVTVAPVWNKSFREHTIIGTRPGDVKREAEDATAALNWRGAFFVDADHVNLTNVGAFIDCSNFFTLDVADFVAKEAPAERIASFVKKHRRFAGRLTVPRIAGSLEVTERAIGACARTYLAAVEEAARIYRRVESVKGSDAFVTEVSMDETDTPQTPLELLFILAAIADLGVPAQTIAPKFTGRFNKGVDYVGDRELFSREFEQDLLVIAFAVREFGLPANLKLSVHSGSDKFSLYPIMHDIMTRLDAGLHLKTAGTTWLEEVTGLAASDGGGLALAKEIYARALDRCDELCAPYASVIDIDRSRLPTAGEVRTWSSSQFVNAVRHDGACPGYNRHIRQLLHVGYKVAAEMGGDFLRALDDNEKVIAGQVSANIYERHLVPLFLGSG